MNQSFIKRSLNSGQVRFAAFCGLAVLTAAMAVGQEGASASTQRTDGQIEMDVVHALDAEQTLKNDLITACRHCGVRFVKEPGRVSGDQSSGRKQGP